MTNFLWFFLYYATFSSAVLVYGIGLKHMVINSMSFSFVKSHLLKNFVVTMAAAPLCRFLLVWIFIPQGLVELLPIMVVASVWVISFAFEQALRKEKHGTTGEMLITMLCVLLAVNESLSFAQLFFIAFTGWFSVFALLAVLYALTVRLQYGRPVVSASAPDPVLVFLTLAFILIALFGWNFSWLNAEVLI